MASILFHDTSLWAKQKRMLLRSVLAWSLFSFLSLSSWDVSRRMANLMYVLWCTAFNATFLCGFASLSAWLGADHPPPRLLTQVNRHGLLLFLLVRLSSLTNRQISLLDLSTYPCRPCMPLHGPRF